LLKGGIRLLIIILLYVSPFVNGNFSLEGFLWGFLNPGIILAYGSFFHNPPKPFSTLASGKNAPRIRDLRIPFYRIEYLASCFRTSLPSLKRAVNIAMRYPLDMGLCCENALQQTYREGIMKSAKSDVAEGKRGK